MGTVALKWGFGSFGKWGIFTVFSKKRICFKQLKKYKNSSKFNYHDPTTKQLFFTNFVLFKI
jgi:hypothetical protein